MTSVFTNPLPAQDVEKLGADIDACRRRARHGGARRGREGRRDAGRRPGRPSRSPTTTWAQAQARSASGLEGVRRREIAKKCLKDVETARKRIEAGIARLKADATSREAFGIMNRVMERSNRQRGLTLNGKPPDQQNAPTWRLFQLAFILLNLDGLVDPDASRPADRRPAVLPDRRRQDRGLSRPRRLRHRAAPAQQSRPRRRGPLGRHALHAAASDARSASARRRPRSARWNSNERRSRNGSGPGRSKSASGSAARRRPTISAARRTARKTPPSSGWSSIARDSGPAPAPLKSCPWCGTEFNKDSFRLHPTAATPQRLDIRCDSADCEFSGETACRSSSSTRKSIAACRRS